MGVEFGGWSFGAQFGDLNNDGYLDLYLTNGYVSADRERSYWYDFSKVAGGNTTIIADAKNWPPMAGRSLSGYQQKRVWLNDGAGQFFDVAPAVGATDTYDGRAVALADLWNRGVLDGSGQSGHCCCTRTPCAGQRGSPLSWKAASNRSAIGTRCDCSGMGKSKCRGVGWQWRGAESAPCAFRQGNNHIEKLVIRGLQGKSDAPAPGNSASSYQQHLSGRLGAV
jgi:hypothetical protein